MDAPQDAPRASFPGDWHGERWRRHQYDRLYVRSAEGVPVGWFDLVSGDVHAVEPSLQHELLAYLADWMAGPEAARISPLPKLRLSRKETQRPPTEGRPGRDLHLRNQPLSERRVPDRSPGRSAPDDSASDDSAPTDGRENAQPQPRRWFCRPPGTRHDR